MNQLAKPIAITGTEASDAALDAAIKEAEGKASARCLSAEDVSEAVADAEQRLACLPKRLWGGAVVNFDPHVVPNSRRGAQSTKIQITRRSSGWALTAVDRNWCAQASYGSRPAAADLRVTLPADIDRAALLETLVDRLHLRLPPVPTTAAA